MGYVGNQASSNFSSMDRDTYSHGGGTTFPLSHNVANAMELEVFVNNVRQEPIESYNAANSTLTFTEALASTDELYVVFQGKAVQTTTPSPSSVTAAMLAQGAAGSYLGDATQLGNIIRVHEKELNTSVTVASNTNGMCAGPLTLASGVVITVSAGATLVVT